MLGQMSPWSEGVTKPRQRALLSSMNVASHALRFAQRVQTKQADEERLVRAAKDDPALFGEIYLAHVDAVFGYLVRRTGSRTVAEDLSADVTVLPYGPIAGKNADDHVHFDLGYITVVPREISEDRMEQPQESRPRFAFEERRGKDRRSPASEEAPTK